MGWFDRWRGTTAEDAQRRAQDAYAARVREEIARIERGESPTGLFGGPPTREAQEFERRFKQQEAERRDWDEVRQVRRGGLGHVPDAHLGPRARDERFYQERDAREAARRQTDAERRRAEERRSREEQEARRRADEARGRDDQRRRQWELQERDRRERVERDRREREAREREARDRQERDRRDREDRERRERERRDRGGRW